MLVYEVLKYTIYEGDSSIQSDIYSSRESAVSKWKEIIENEHNEEDGVVTSIDEDGLSYVEYIDGRGDDYSFEVYVTEHKLLS